MATITYKCNTCHRTISKLENQSGMTVFAKCIITEDCLGQLYTVSRNKDNVRESFPFSVGGVVDYSPRKAFYQHTQTVLSSTWLVKHDLSTSPAVSVYATDINGQLHQLNQDDFTIVIVNKNTINLIFNQPYTGIAQCIARSTTTTTSVAATASTQIKITNNGLITIAIPEIIVSQAPTPDTVMEFLPFGLDLIIKRPNEEERTSLENITSGIDVRSAWADWPKILIRKRRNYVVRTINIFGLLVFGTNAKPSDIANGTRFRFENVMWPNSLIRRIESRELFFLLSNPPYASIDKVKDKLIDVGEMIDTPVNYFTYRDGELYVDSSVVETTYPGTVKVTNAS